MINKATLLSVLILVTFITGCTSGNAQQITRQTKVDRKTLLSPSEFEQKMSELPDAQLVDVREPEELKYGYIQQAVNIDYHAQDFEKALQMLDKNKPVLVYCMSGGRSAKAAQILKKLGFSEVYDLDGGFAAWETAGKAVEK